MARDCFIAPPGYALRRRVDAAGAPRPLPPAPRFVIVAGPRAKDPAGWVAALKAAGAKSFRLEGSMPAGRLAAFWRDSVHAAFAAGLVEEWTAETLRRLIPAERASPGLDGFEGLDLINELRSLTQGVASFAWKFDRLQEFTGKEADQITADRAAG